MIVGIGIDLVEIERIRKLAERYDSFLGRVFAPAELEHCQAKQDPYPHLAARIAAKEAVFKALGTGWSGGVTWSDVVVENDSAGGPTVRLSGTAEQVARDLGVQKTHLSLTHGKAYACAQVVMEGAQEETD